MISALCLLGTGGNVLAAGSNAMGSDAAAAVRSAGGPVTQNPANGAGRALWHGQTYATWTQDFWKWLYSIPVKVTPGADPTGANCSINQEGPVWYLSGPLVPTFTNACTVPAGTPILAPINTFLNDYPCPEPPAFEPAPGQTLESFLLEGIAPTINGVTSVWATLDGRSLPVRRVTAGLFGFTAAASNSANDSCVTGSPQLGVVDGYYAFIEGLPRGQHVLQLHSTNGSNDYSGTFNLTVQ